MLVHTNHNWYEVLERDGEYVCNDSSHAAIKRQLDKSQIKPKCSKPILGQRLVISHIDHYNDVITTTVTQIEV